MIKQRLNILLKCKIKNEVFRDSSQPQVIYAMLESKS